MDQIIARLKTQIEKNDYTLSVLEKSLQTILRALETEVGTPVPETKPAGEKDKIRDILETKLERKENKLSTLEGSLRMIIRGLDYTHVRNTEVPLDIIDVIRRKDKIIDSLKTKIEDQERKDEKISGTIASINGIIEVIRADEPKQIEPK